MHYTYLPPYSSIRYKNWVTTLAIILIVAASAALFALGNSYIQTHYRKDYQKIMPYLAILPVVSILFFSILATRFTGGSAAYYSRKKKEKREFIEKYGDSALLKSPKTIYFLLFGSLIFMGLSAYFYKDFENSNFLKSFPFDFDTVIYFVVVPVYLFLLALFLKKGTKKWANNLNQVIPNTKLEVGQNDFAIETSPRYRARSHTIYPELSHYKADVDFKGTYRGLPFYFSQNYSMYDANITAEIQNPENTIKPAFELLQKKKVEKIETYHLDEAFLKRFECSIAPSLLPFAFKEACFRFPYFIQLSVTPGSFKFNISFKTQRFNQDSPWLTSQGQVLFFDSVCDLYQNLRQ